MTTTDPDYLALLRNVLHAPHDDLPRLVLADWLEEPERAGSVPCGACKGQVLATDLDTGEACAWCLTCNGMGYVSNGNAERAEFIRLQVASSGGEVSDWEIKIAHANRVSWFGLGEETAFSVVPHDLRNELKSGIHALVSRGFVGSVRLTAEQFMQHAAELFAQHPITEVVLSGKEPWETQNGFSWWLNSNRIEDNHVDDIIPSKIFYLLDGYKKRDENYIRYPTRELALAALSRACVRVGRRRAGLPEEYQQ